MKSLILLRRPGILVVSGIVQGADHSGVVIKNYLGAQEKELLLQVKPSVQEALRLKPGTMIIASTMDDFRIEMLLDGANINEMIELPAYTVRYNGSFDFEAKGDRKEQHVFSGTILSANAGRRAGRPVCAATIGWRKKGQEEIRNVIFDPKSVPEYAAGELQNKRMIFVTEAARESGTEVYYAATAAYTA